MSTLPITALLWAAALGSGLMAGVYFAFSAFIMKAFDTLETAHAVSAMNAINEVILRSLFMPLFFASTIISLLLGVAAFVYRDEAGAVLALIAGLVYFVGMFVCTVVFNVPLNNTLSNLDPVSGNAQQTWSHYLNKWTQWNHLRTVSSLVTCALCIWLLSKY